MKMHPFIWKNIMNKIYFGINLIKKDLRLKVEYRFFDSFPSKLKNNIEWKEKERKYFFIQLADGIIYHWMVKMDGSFDQRLNESSCILTKRTRLYFRCYHVYLQTHIAFNKRKLSSRFMIDGALKGSCNLITSIFILELQPKFRFGINIFSIMICECDICK